MVVVSKPFSLFCSGARDEGPGEKKRKGKEREGEGRVLLASLLPLKSPCMLRQTDERLITKEEERRLTKTIMKDGGRMKNGE